MPNVAALIYSTLSTTIEYVKYRENSAKELPIKEFGVVIKGGAGVAPKRKGLETKYGEKTEVTDIELAFLERDATFRKHVENGWIIVVHTTAFGGPSVDAVIGDLAHRDGSSPFVPADYAPDKTPSVGKATGGEVTSKPRHVPLRNMGMFR